MYSPIDHIIGMTSQDNKNEESLNERWFIWNLWFINIAGECKQEEEFSLTYTPACISRSLPASFPFWRVYFDVYLKGSRWIFGESKRNHLIGSLGSNGAACGFEHLSRCTTSEEKTSNWFSISALEKVEQSFSCLLSEEKHFVNFIESH